MSSRFYAFGQLRENLLDDEVRLHAFGFTLEVQENAVTQRRKRGNLDVSDRRREPSVEERANLRGEEHRLRAARRRARPHVTANEIRRVGVGRVRREENAHRVVLDVLRDRHGSRERLHLKDVRLVDDRLHTRRAIRRRAIENLMKLVARRKSDVKLQEETVELRLGQWIRSFHLEGVLRREHEIRRCYVVSAPTDRYSALLHGFEQRTLRLRRRAIHLVREDDVAEYGTFPELEGAAPALRLVDDRRSDDVGRHEVRRELNAREFEAHRIR